MDSLASPSPPQLFDLDTLRAALEQGESPAAAFKGCLQQGRAWLDQRFEDGERARNLIRQHAWLIDQLLELAWVQHALHERPYALLAVGGYGRSELHPASDIDVAIVIPRAPSEAEQALIEQFVVFLWDIGLEVGHSVRTVAQCAEEARRDVTVVTNLMEARLIAGAARMAERVSEAVGPERMWSPRRFFEAKRAEQISRHRKYHDTAHNLEPNIKEGPGGLRDIQMIAWVARRHFGSTSLEDLCALGFLTDQEFQALDAGREFLWRLRYALHLLNGRREDRLLFDHQREVAQMFGYNDQEGRTLGVEQFMRMYHCTVTELSRLNEMLLSIFEEEILLPKTETRVKLLNKRFQVRNGYMEARDDRVFERYPFALLEVFLLLQQNPDVSGVRASTIRLIREHRHLIDDEFRNDLRCRSLFMEIIRQPRRLGHELERMHRYGILELYLPSFGAVSGLMQFDLFHVYTVDEHTLKVVRNMRRFWFPGGEGDHLPLAQQIAIRLSKPELLYLAGLFHDIAKGRGGDHSVLGEQDALEFCRQHQLSAYDTRLVGWLVRRHLDMSRTTQRCDISDPAVINEFARMVGDREHLDYLYLLTVADVRGTNPKLWNSWRDSLLADLYRSTLRALRRGLEHPIDKAERLFEVRSEARRLLYDRGLPHARVEALWESLTEDYFLRHRADEVAWHTDGIIGCQEGDLPLVLLRPGAARGGSELFVYAREADHIFAVTTQVLDRMGLTIQDARIITTSQGYTLDTYVVLEAESGEPVTGESRVEEIIDALRSDLGSGRTIPRRNTRRVGRQLRNFSIPTSVSFSQDEGNQRTVMEVVGTDRPGFLSRVGMAMRFCGARLQNARVATFGERVEDIFFLTGPDDGPIDDPIRFECLRKTILEALNNTAGQ